MGRYYCRPAAMDPDFSVDVFDADCLNEFGTPYCVEVAVTPDQGARVAREHNAALRITILHAEGK